MLQTSCTICYVGATDSVALTFGAAEIVHLHDRVHVRVFVHNHVCDCVYVFVGVCGRVLVCVGKIH